MGKIYTITKQLHEQKGLDIWVVRIIPKVEKEVFYDLRTLSKDMDGYYSSYRGVNGFVFKTENDAQSFANSLQEYIVIPEEINEELLRDESKNKRKKSKNQNIKDKAEGTGSKKKKELNPSKLPLHEALRTIIDIEGKEILNDIRLINILDDYKAFEEIPSSKFILKTLITEKFFQNIHGNVQDQDKITTKINQFLTYTGLTYAPTMEIIKAVFESFGIEWLLEVGEKDAAIKEEVIVSSELKFYNIPFSIGAKKMIEELLKKEFKPFLGENNLNENYIALKGEFCEMEVIVEIWQTNNIIEEVQIEPTDEYREDLNLFNHLYGYEELVQDLIAKYGYNFYNYTSPFPCVSHSIPLEGEHLKLKDFDDILELLDQENLNLRWNMKDGNAIVLSRESFFGTFKLRYINIRYMNDLKRMKDIKNQSYL